MSETTGGHAFIQGLEPGRRQPFERSADELSPIDYFKFRDDLCDDIRQGLVGQTFPALFRRAHYCAGVTKAVAAEWVERVMADLARHLERDAPPTGGTPRP